LFSNLIEITEFYVGYSTAPSVFSNNVATNVVQSLFALNGALTNSPNPPYTIVSNLLYMENSENGVQTTPAQNVYVIGNTFIGSDGSGTACAFGTAGYQGSAVNSNIVVAGNLFSNVFGIFAVEGSAYNAVYNLTITNNQAIYTRGGGPMFAGGYGWATNIVISNNITSGFLYGLDSVQMMAEYYPDNPSNLFPPHQYYGYSGSSNTITYQWGLRQSITYNQATNVLWVMDDTHPAQVPAGAMMAVTNTQPTLVTVYMSALQYPAGGSVVLTNQAVLMCQWTNASWQVIPNPEPPNGLHVINGGG
jgi:hypothetical protein